MATSTISLNALRPLSHLWTRLYMTCGRCTSARHHPLALTRPMTLELPRAVYLWTRRAMRMYDGPPAIGAPFWGPVAT